MEKTGHSTAVINQFFKYVPRIQSKLHYPFCITYLDKTAY